MNGEEEAPRVSVRFWLGVLVGSVGMLVWMLVITLLSLLSLQQMAALVVIVTGLTWTWRGACRDVNPDKKPVWEIVIRWIQEAGERSGYKAGQKASRRTEI